MMIIQISLELGVSIIQILENSGVISVQTTVLVWWFDVRTKLLSVLQMQLADMHVNIGQPNI